MSRRTLFYSFGILIIFGAALLLGFGYYLMTPLKPGAPKKAFVVEEGATLRQVAARLQEQGIIKGKGLFVLWARVTGAGTRIKSGEYLLGPSMPPAKVLATLVRGRVRTHPVTIPEGFTAAQIARLLEAKGLADKEEFLKLVKDPEFARALKVPSSSLEGYLYPDTYYFSVGLSPRAIIKEMVRRFWEVMGQLSEEIERSGMSLHEVVTLASIVEKETGRPEERPLIASVFLNRLKKGMRLESDPTVIYGLKDFDGNLTRRHLATPTPYNTYQIKGLPPGPIANPGIDSIKAVLNPVETDFLYFVSRNDGTHHFSSTLREHNKAVYKFQKHRKSRNNR